MRAKILQQKRKDELTLRDLEALQYAADGMTTEEIAQELFLAPKTVEHLLSNSQTRGLFPKIGVKNRPEATAWYTRATNDYKHLRRTAEDSLRRIHNLRLRGQSQFALNYAEEITDQLREEIDNRFSLLGKAEILLRLLADIDFEQLIAFYETALPKNIWLFVKPRIKEIRDIAQFCDDTRLSGEADYIEGLAYYIAGQPVASIRALNTAWEKLHHNDDRLKILRTIALNWAYCQDVQRFNEVAQKARAYINDGAFSDVQYVCMTLEGLGRGQGILQLTSAFDTLDESWRYYEKIAQKRGKLPIRYVQLTRSELEVAQYLRPKNREWLEKRAHEGLRLANEYGYLRYVKQIQTLSKQF
ncbi:MAG: LuxR family transcriptional regulator [Chloroflexi bacterium]|nr:MAG: LuxR family transcriptional regulator [Chloroflexota bacterium]